MQVLISMILVRVCIWNFSTIHPPARKKQHLSSSALHYTAAETAWRNRSPCNTVIYRRLSSNHHRTSTCPKASEFESRLDVVDVNLLLAGAVSLVAAVRVAVLVELEADALVTLVAVRVGLVDLCVLGKLAVGF